MLEKHRIGGVLLMGGIGRRFGSNTPKQFHRLAGKCVFLHTLEIFLSARIFDEIVLCCHPDWMDMVRPLLPASACPIQLVAAGTTRQESSYRGLLGFAKKPDIVVIHDAVRPFITPELLTQNALGAIKTGAIDTCIPSADTLVQARDGYTISAIPQRSHYLRGQTPQTFSYSLILTAHQKTQKKDVSDDCQLVLDMGHPISIVPGDENNLKITSELDLFLAEQLVRLRLQERKPNIKNATLQGKRFAVVGGTGGIGSALLRKITLLGGEPIALSRKTSPIPINLSSPASIKWAFFQLAERFGPLDGLVNCAGHLLACPLNQLPLNEINDALDVNLKGLILSCRLAHLKKGAHVINIASSSFSRGRKNTTVYSSAKAGVVNFTQGWAEERPDLHIHAIIPQRTNTLMRQMNFPNEDTKTLLDPKAVADAIIDLLLDNSLTGLLVEVKNIPNMTQKSVLGSRSV